MEEAHGPTRGAGDGRNHAAVNNGVRPRDAAKESKFCWTTRHLQRNIPSQPTQPPPTDAPCNMVDVHPTAGIGRFFTWAATMRRANFKGL